MIDVNQSEGRANKRNSYRTTEEIKRFVFAGQHFRNHSKTLQSNRHRH